MINYEQEQELKDRISEKFTSMEVVELLDIPVEDIVDLFWPSIVNHLDLFEVE